MRFQDENVSGIEYENMRWVFYLRYCNNLLYHIVPEIVKVSLRDKKRYLFIYNRTICHNHSNINLLPNSA